MLEYLNIPLKYTKYLTQAFDINVNNLDYYKFNYNKEFKNIERLLCENSKLNRGNLKRKLIKFNFLENKCSICGLLPFWNNKELVLILDHINGINNDNRLKNLRLVCPNCDSQLDTFTGKNKNNKGCDLY